jgi:hypothetical protein
MEKRGSGVRADLAYGTYARFWNRETRIPCQNPPFGEMIAVDLASGDRLALAAGRSRLWKQSECATRGREPRRKHRDGRRYRVCQSDE